MAALFSLYPMENFGLGWGGCGLLGAEGQGHPAAIKGGSCEQPLLWGLGLMPSKHSSSLCQAIQGDKILGLQH